MSLRALEQIVLGLLAFIFLGGHVYAKSKNIKCTCTKG